MLYDLVGNTTIASVNTQQCIDLAFDIDLLGSTSVLCLVANYQTNPFITLINFKSGMVTTVGAYPYLTVSNDDWAYSTANNVYYMRLGSSTSQNDTHTPTPHHRHPFPAARAVWWQCGAVCFMFECVGVVLRCVVVAVVVYCIPSPTFQRRRVSRRVLLQRRARRYSWA